MNILFIQTVLPDILYEVFLYNRKGVCCVGQKETRVLRPFENDIK